jgi:hypothetical protein
LPKPEKTVPPSAALARVRTHQRHPELTKEDVHEGIEQAYRRVADLLGEKGVNFKDHSGIIGDELSTLLNEQAAHLRLHAGSIDVRVQVRPVS